MPKSKKSPKLKDHRNRDRAGSVGQQQNNPDMEPVNFVKDLKPTTKNANLTVIILRWEKSGKLDEVKVVTFGYETLGYFLFWTLKDSADLTRARSVFIFFEFH